MKIRPFFAILLCVVTKFVAYHTENKTNLTKTSLGSGNSNTISGLGSFCEINSIPDARQCY